MYIGGMKWTGYSLNGTPAKPGTYEFKLRAEIEDTVPLIFVDVPYTITVLDSSSKPLTIDDNMLLQQRLQTYTPPKSRCPEGRKKTFSLTAPRAAQSFLQGLLYRTPAPFHAHHRQQILICICYMSLYQIKQIMLLRQ